MDITTLMNFVDSFRHHPNIWNFEQDFEAITQRNFSNNAINIFINDLRIREIITDFFMRYANTNNPELRDEILNILNSFHPTRIRTYLFELFTEVFDRGYYETKDGGNIPINCICLGGKLKIKTLKKVVSNGYKKKNKEEELDGYKLDNQLSGSRVQVYHNPKDNKTIINHRGTQGLNDLITDFKMMLGDSNNKRFNHGKQITDKAIDKYADSDITLTGHSLGSKIAKESNKLHNKNTILLNPVVLPNDKFDKTDTIVKSKLDPVSFLYNPKSQKSKTIEIKSKSLNPINEHKTQILNRLDGEIEI